MVRREAVAKAMDTAARAGRRAWLVQAAFLDGLYGLYSWEQES